MTKNMNWICPMTAIFNFTICGTTVSFTAWHTAEIDLAQNLHIETTNEVRFLKNAYRSLSRAMFQFFVLTIICASDCGTRDNHGPFAHVNVALSCAINIKVTNGLDNNLCDRRLWLSSYLILSIFLSDSPTDGLSNLVRRTFYLQGLTLIRAMVIYLVVVNEIAYRFTNFFNDAVA